MCIKYPVLLFSLLVQTVCTAQSYSNTISDRIIEAIMDCELRQLYASSLDCDKFAPGKIDKKILEWRDLVELYFDSLHLITDLLPEETQDTLKSIPEIFSEKDFKYMAWQIGQETGARWQLPPGNLRFVNKCRKTGCARFSIPLFNETHTKAILYEEEIYNPMAACGLIKVYILENHQWKKYKSITIWLL